MVNKPELRAIAEAFSYILRREKIDSNADVEKRLGLNYKLSRDINMKDRVSLSEGSLLGNRTYLLAYEYNGSEAPIQVRINEKNDYNEFIVRCHKEVDGYEVFDNDASGNKLQSRLMKPADFSSIKGELERLRRVGL